MKALFASSIHRQSPTFYSQRFSLLIANLTAARMLAVSCAQISNISEHFPLTAVGEVGLWSQVLTRSHACCKTPKVLTMVVIAKAMTSYKLSAHAGNGSQGVG